MYSIHRHLCVLAPVYRYLTLVIQARVTVDLVCQIPHYFPEITAHTRAILHRKDAKIFPDLNIHATYETEHLTTISIIQARNFCTSFVTLKPDPHYAFTEQIPTTTRYKLIQWPLLPNTPVLSYKELPFSLQVTTFMPS